MDKEFLTPEEARKRLGFSRNRMYAWLQAGRIPNIRDRGHYFIPSASIPQLVEQVLLGKFDSAACREPAGTSRETAGNKKYR